jgi:hypothetical protein
MLDMANEIKYTSSGKIPFKVLAITKTTRAFSIKRTDITETQAELICEYINKDSNTKVKCKFEYIYDPFLKENVYYFTFQVLKSRVGLETPLYNAISLYLGNATKSTSSAPTPAPAPTTQPAPPKTKAGTIYVRTLPITGTNIQAKINTKPLDHFFTLPIYDDDAFNKLLRDLGDGITNNVLYEWRNEYGQQGDVKIIFNERALDQAEVDAAYQELDKILEKYLEGYLAYKNAPAAAQPAATQTNVANLDGIKLGDPYFLLPVTKIQIYKVDVFNIPIYSFYLTGQNGLANMVQEAQKVISLSRSGWNPSSTLIQDNPEIYKIEFEILGDNLEDEEGVFLSIDLLLQSLGYLKPITPDIVPQASAPKTDALIDIEANVDKLKTELDQLVFLRSLNSELEFEKNIELGQKIANVKEKINELNFSKLEAKLTTDDIFDQLFEQSFTPIQHVYSNLKVTKEEEGDFFTPNGKPSELSEQLNELIRTQQFKDWFGDWQLTYMYKQAGDMDTDCSVVLTENFEPKLFYHGTGQEFSYFKFDKFPAAYFAANQAYSQWFANLHGGDNGYTIPFFLNVRNPLDLTQFGIEEIRPKDFFDYMYLQTGLDPEQLEVNPLFLNPSAPARECWVYLRNNPKMLKKLADNQVYDGIHFYETNPGVDKGLPAYQTEVYITFKAEQCKIADNNRGLILMASLKSFLLKEGGKI